MTPSEEADEAISLALIRLDSAEDTEDTVSQTWLGVSVCRSVLSHFLVPIIQMAHRCLYEEHDRVPITVLLLTLFCNGTGYRPGSSHSHARYA